MPRITLDMAADDLQKYIMDAIDRHAENHDGLTRWMFGDYRHAVVVSWMYRGNQDDAFMRDLDNVLDGFAAKIAEVIAEELVSQDSEAAE